MYQNLEDLFKALSRSKFRSRFHLSPKDKVYVKTKGIKTIASHARDFIDQRLKADNPKDGRQTPMRGHPVFVAQHATGCCCRGCLEKWHGIGKDHELTKEEKDYILRVLMTWIEREMEA